MERSLCTRVFPMVVSKTWYRQSIRLWITRSGFASLIITVQARQDRTRRLFSKVLTQGSSCYTRYCDMYKYINACNFAAHLKRRIRKSENPFLFLWLQRILSANIYVSFSSVPFLMFKPQVASISRRHPPRLPVDSAPSIPCSLRPAFPRPPRHTSLCICA